MYAVHHLLFDICREIKGREQERIPVIKLKDFSLVVDGQTSVR
jgi:hypothetical protein